MKRYGRLGVLTAKPGKSDELINILLQAADVVKNIGGCHQYLVANDKSEPNRVWVSELWESKDAHSRSLQNDDVRNLISKAIPILDESPDLGGEFDVIGGLEWHN